MSEIFQTVIEAERPPTKQELKDWDRARNLLDACVGWNKSAVLLWKNLTVLSEFLTDANVSLSSFDPARLATLEQRHISVARKIEAAKKLIRLVEDQSYGLRWTGKDFDIIEPQTVEVQQNTEGFGVIPFVPIAIGMGVVALVGLIAHLMHLSEEAEYVRGQYNDILEKSDKTLCKDPASATCKNWQATKEQKRYEVNKSFSERIKESLGGVLGKGAGIAIIGLAAFMALSLAKNK